jgi:hypothetical protein
MDVRWLNPQRLGYLLLEASATGKGKGVIFAEGLRNWDRPAVPILNYILAFALQLRKSPEKVRVAEQC